MPRINDDDARPMTTLEKLSRRAFLSRAGTTGVASTATAIAMPAANAASEIAEEGEPKTQPVPGAMPVTLKVNGETHQIQIDPRATLLDTLRETLN